MSNQKCSVVFVCMGNICRSPTAEGVFRHVVDQRGLSNQIFIDSAGTHAYHVGEKPDSRARATANNRGIDLSSQRARKIKVQDFEQFDYVIAMDRSNYQNLTHFHDDLQTSNDRSNLYLFMSFATGWDNEEVPDPYYGGDKGFETVFDMVQSASEGLLDHIITHNL